MGTTRTASKNSEANKRLKAINKERIEALRKERIKSEMKQLSEERGQVFRDKDLAAEIGVTRGLVSKWFNGKQEIKDYHLQAMAELFHVEKSWLDGSGNARTHESYNSVIKKTGLSEASIQILIEKTENSETNYYPDGDYIDTINYLITEGSDFLNTFRIARKNTLYLQKSLQEHIIPYGLDDSIVAVALEWFPGVTHYEEAPGQFSFDIFKKEMSNYRFSVKGSDRRHLTDEELLHLYKHCQTASIIKPDINQWNCEQQLRKLFAAIEDSN